MIIPQSSRFIISSAKHSCGILCGLYSGKPNTRPSGAIQPHSHSSIKQGLIQLYGSTNTLSGTKCSSFCPMSFARPLTTSLARFSGKPIILLQRKSIPTCLSLVSINRCRAKPVTNSPDTEKFNVLVVSFFISIPPTLSNQSLYL